MKRKSMVSSNVLLDPGFLSTAARNPNGAHFKRELRRSTGEKIYDSIYQDVRHQSEDG